MKKMKLGLVAATLLLMLPSSSWALSEDDFFCLPAPFGLPSVFSKEVKGCGDANGRVSVSRENMCSEGARCTYITDDLKQKRFKTATGSIVTIAQFTPAQKQAYFQRLYDADYEAEKGTAQVPGMGDRWVVSDMFCPVRPNGRCPLPQDCKGDIFYDAKAADYEHPSVDFEVVKSAKGTSQIVQHQGEGAGSAVSAPLQEVPQ